MPIDESQINNFAVYGTLKSETPADKLDKGVTSLGLYRLPGIIYAIPNRETGVGNYPGAVLSQPKANGSSNMNDTFQVEILNVDGDAESLEDLLKDLDNFKDGLSGEEEYHRVLVEADGIKAWIYEYAGDTKGLLRVKDGVWNIAEENTAAHSINYSANTETWYCSICGLKGLDGEESPRDSECITL